ncbi:hypothetical protein [Aurantiacibacter luteus]|uniref:Uncharacterized protein n=1 Tax=Aurantiacibacter luteus TaxID=1581420 RepID=A0A0G9MYA4_9SPHN|nr:hypothetical protein [Aurantiacibacter luteus]KLE35757.1 hypothetical protein AAW00_05070 [Aurantiacibacter luteus]
MAIVFGIVLSLIVCLPMRRFATDQRRAVFARNSVLRAGLIEFVLLLIFGIFMRGWVNGAAIFLTMQWQAWVLIAVSLFTVWLMALLLAPRRDPATFAEVFD